MSVGLFPLYPRPRQLPADVADFVGREELLRSVVDLITPFPQVVLLTGAVGTGKTALAVHVAHRVANGHFPDGQLYVRLRGTSAHEVLSRFLLSLGESVPSGFASRVRAYRDAVARQQLLVVLDDATNWGQIAPLLPDAPGCAVIVTSRRVLPLPHVVEVGALASAHAMSLLERQVGSERLEREPGRADELVALLGGLPLAVRVAGARLAARPHWTLTMMLNRLNGPDGRLPMLSYGGLCLRSRLLDACDDLSPSARRLLGLLAGVGARELPSWAPDAAFGDPRGQSAMDELVAAHLVEVVGDRYVLPDLVREHAAGHPDAQQSLSRVLGGFLYLLDLAHSALYCGDFAGIRGESPRQVVPSAPTDPVRWLESERESLCAAVEIAAAAGMAEQAWEIAHKLVSLFEVKAGYDDWQRTSEIALKACEAAGNRRGMAAMWCSLGTLHITRCHYDMARETCTLAKETFEDIGYLPGLGLAYRNLGIVNRASGDFESARRWYQRALAVFERISDPVGQASALQNLAQVDLYERDLASAFARLTAAREVCVGPPRMLAQITYRLGKLLACDGKRDQAFETLSDALVLARTAGDSRGESFVLYVLGVNEFARGKPGGAMAFLQEAAAICESNFDVVGAARARLDLARVYRSCGDPELAASMESAARAVYTEFGLRAFKDDMIFQL